MKPGDVIDGKYRIEVELGEGGMGKVFAASHMAIGSMVAIKVLRPEAMSSTEVPKRFMREARAAGRLRSEHVVRVIDVGALHSGEPYMVMEMLHGNDLATRLKVGPLPAAQAVEYIVQACEGLAEAHAQGMVHRDVKPANLFVTARPNGAAMVKVVDFGIATAATGDLDPRLTTTQSVMGSPSYMSPEQLKGARDVDARSDIWSIGVTLYELLSGTQPFVGPTLTALSLSIVTDPHPRLTGIPENLADIIDRCLEKNPAHRFQNVAELARALSPLFTGGFVAADLVAGSYSQPVPPTLLGLDRAATSGTDATVLPVARVAGSRRSAPVAVGPYSAAMSNAAPHMTSTTSLASGETGTSIPSRRGSRWMWITAGVATVALGIGVGLVVGMRKDPDATTATSSANQPQPQITPPSPPPTPPKTEPKPTVEPIEVKNEPVKVEVPATDKDPKTIEAKVDPKKKPPVTIVKRPPRGPAKPPKPPKVDPDPPKTDPKPVVDPPKKDPDPPKPPKPGPCAPNDPRCGL